MAWARSVAVVVAVASTVLLSGCAVPGLQAGRPLDGQSLADYYTERWEEMHDLIPSLMRPEVMPVKRVPDREWTAVIVACIAEYGLTDEGPNAVALSELVCEQQYPSESGFEVDRQDDDREALSNWVRFTLLPCLRLAGQPAEPSPAQPVDVQNGFTWLVNDPKDRDAGTAFRIAGCPAPDSLGT